MSGNPNQSPAPDNESDTYDIAQILNGTWYGVSGSGTATGPYGTFTARMESLEEFFSETYLSGNTCMTRAMGSHVWNAYSQDGVFVRKIVFENTGVEPAELIHYGLNTWRFEDSNGEILTIKLTSSTTAEAVYEGDIEVDGYMYHYFLNITAKKRTSSDDNSGMYNIAQVLNGTWYGISGEGIIAETGGVFTARMAELEFTFSNVRVYGSKCTAISTWHQKWYGSSYGADYDLEMKNDGDNETVSLTHYEGNTWRYESNNGLTTLKLTSPTTAEVTQDGIYPDSYGTPRHHAFNVTMMKRGGSTPAPEPETPGNSGDYAIEKFEGNWHGYNGSGVAESAGKTFELRLSSVNAKFSNVNDSGSMNVTASVKWNLYQDGSFFSTISMNYHNEQVSVQKIDADTWRYKFSSNGITATVKFTSAGAEVTEEGTFRMGNYNYQYHASYDMIK